MSSNRAVFKEICSIERICPKPSKTNGRPFHGGNTGSNPVGDAKSFHELAGNR